MPNEWRSDIVLVEHFPEHLKELSDTGYSIFSAVQHSVDGYYLIVSYPNTQMAGQFSFLGSSLKITESFGSGIILPSVTTANNSQSVSTFTFPQVVHKAHVYVYDPANTNHDDYFRVDPFGGTPSLTAGMIGKCNSELEIHTPVQTLKVWVGDEHNITVWGYYNP